MSLFRANAPFLRYPLYRASADNRARFVLGRQGQCPLFVLGANPSTADQYRSDMTLAKVERFASGEGFEGLVMLNLYPLRATRPDDLPLMADENLMRWNLCHIRAQLEPVPSPVIWAAWGNVIGVRPYLLSCLRRISAGTAFLSSRWIACGPLTRAGHPRHPSRLAYAARFRPFDLGGYLQCQADQNLP